MLRVANIIEEAKLGGPQVRIANVAYALRDKVETTVIIPRENSEHFRNKLDDYKIQYKVFNLSRVTKEFKVAFRYLFFSWLEIINLIRYFRKEKFDLIHVSGGSWQYKGVIAGKLAGMKVIWHLNDTSMPWFFRKIFSLLSNLPDAYIFASQRTREYYKALTRSDLPEFIVPAPVDTKRFSPTIHVEGDEALIASWDNKTVIGTVANVNPVKGLDIFIRVAAELNKKIKNLQFVVVGTIYPNQEKYYNELTALSKIIGVDNIEFIGMRNDVRPLLKRIDLYLCTSYAESSPISVWEAMSMGKPIVSSSVGDVPIYLKPGITGEVVSVADIEGTAIKAEEILTNDELLIQYQTHSREIAIQELDISKCATKHFQVYQEVSKTRMANAH